MSWTIGLRNPNFIVKSSYDEVDNMPFMSSALPVTLVTAAYLLFVLKIGPALMKDRKPLNLKNVLIVYNLLQVVMSLYIVLKGMQYLTKYGLFHTGCYADHKDMRKETFFLTWLYLMAKVSEFFDTIFFVLRKKHNQVSFLHVYHHSLMMTGTWFFLKFTPHDNMLFVGVLNSLVHVFMYTYYALSAIPSLAKFLWWKKYITTLQLVQFVMVFLYYQINVMYYCDCPPNKALSVFITLNNFLFVYLFGKFYIDNYRKNGGLEAKPNKDVINNNVDVKEVKRKIKAQ